MTAPIRWGILGPGSIAHKFAVGLQAISEGELVAVGSRDRQRADAFADQYGAPNRHTSYEALSADPDVDAVYVATPSSLSQRQFDSLSRSRQGRALREALYHQCRRGRGRRRLCPRQWRLFDGGHVEPLSAHYGAGAPVARRWCHWRATHGQRRLWFSRGRQSRWPTFQPHFGRRCLARHRHLRRLLSRRWFLGRNQRRLSRLRTSAKLALTSKPASYSAIAVVPSPTCLAPSALRLRTKLASSAAKGRLSLTPSWWKGESATLKAGVLRRAHRIALGGQWLQLRGARSRPLSRRRSDGERGHVARRNCGADADPRRSPRSRSA